MWVTELRTAPKDDIVSRTRLHLVTIAAHGLRMVPAPNKVTNAYRFRSATRLGEMDPKDRPAAWFAKEDGQQTDAQKKAMHTAQEAELGINALLHRASALSNDKTLRMEHSTVEFLKSAFPQCPAPDAAPSTLSQTSSEADCFSSLRINVFDTKQVTNVNTSNRAQPDQEPVQPAGISARAEAGKKALPKRRSSKPNLNPAAPQCPPNFLWSPAQQACISAVTAYCQAIVAWKASPAPDPANLPNPPRMLILGPPGSGKSALTKELTRLVNEAGMSSISSAMTAVASRQMSNGGTCHSRYTLTVNKNKKQKSTRNMNLPLLSPLKKRILCSKMTSSLAEGLPVVTVIDEVSMMTAATLGHIIGRYEEIPEMVPGTYILVGDFQQIQPVAGETIFTTMMAHRFDPKDAPQAAANNNNVTRPQARGIGLLKQMTLYNLDSQQRSLHEQHTKNIKHLSTKDPRVHPIDPSFMAWYPAITPAEIAADPLWLKAPIIVANNSIRHQINETQLSAHAKRSGLPVLFWRNLFTGDNQLLLKRAEIEQLYSTHPSLTSYFVQDVTCYIKDNVCTAKGIVNGAQCVTHSLTLDPKETSERVTKGMAPLHEAIRKAKPGDHIELALPPLSVNVTLLDTAMSSKDTLLAGQALIPMMVSGFNRVEKIKPWELGRRNELPFDSIGYADHGLDLGYSITFHKCQGRTIERVILETNKYPKVKLNHSMVLVGLTRVRDLAHIRTMPLLDGQTNTHLYKLRADPVMLAWLKGFETDSGLWSYSKAHESLNQHGVSGHGLSTPARQRKARSSDSTNEASSAPPAAARKPASQTPPATSSSSQRKERDQSSSGQRLAAPRKVQSHTFSIASQGRIANMKDFRGSFRSYENSGAGDCLFESFRQALGMTDPVLLMLSQMVAQLQYSTDNMRVTQLNEHIMREIDAGNLDYMGFRDLNESNTVITMDSADFVQLWHRYKEDMEQDNAWGGWSEAVALANLYKVNVSVWHHNTHNSTATHITTHLQSPPADRTVHLLNTNNVHYEATNLQMTTFPQIADLSSQAAARPHATRSRAAVSDQQGDQRPSSSGPTGSPSSSHPPTHLQASDAMLLDIPLLCSPGSVPSSVLSNTLRPANPIDSPTDSTRRRGRHNATPPPQVPSIVQFFLQ